MNKLKNKNSIVAFLDILGFKELISQNEKLEDDRLLNDLQEAQSIAIKKAIINMEMLLSDIDKSDNVNIRKNFKYRVFSDNVYLSFDYDEDVNYEMAVYFLVHTACWYQRIMMSKKFYVRGGISDGQNFIDKNIIFSKALIKAYEIENTISIYPRIVIDDIIIRKLESKNFINTSFKKLIVIDWARTFFLNPFNLMDMVLELIADNPNIGEEISTLIENNKEILNNEPDITDDDLIKIVEENLKYQINRNKNNYHVHSKYLWLREFKNWVFKKETDLGFEYY